VRLNPKSFLSVIISQHHHHFSSFLARLTTSSRALESSPRVIFPLAMAASHPDMFQQSIVDESEILKLVENCFLPTRAVLQWRPAKGEDIPTPNTKEIVVFSSFF
jgi:hypothetical protein